MVGVSLLYWAWSLSQRYDYYPPTHHNEYSNHYNGHRTDNVHYQPLEPEGRRRGRGRGGRGKGRREGKGEERNENYHSHKLLNDDNHINSYSYM